jgi:hypothetical protein
MNCFLDRFYCQRKSPAVQKQIQEFKMADVCRDSNVTQSFIDQMFRMRNIHFGFVSKFISLICFFSDINRPNHCDVSSVEWMLNSSIEITLDFATILYKDDSKFLKRHTKIYQYFIIQIEKDQECWKTAFFRSQTKAKSNTIDTYFRIEIIQNWLFPG